MIDTLWTITMVAAWIATARYLIRDTRAIREAARFGAALLALLPGIAGAQNAVRIHPTGSVEFPTLAAAWPNPFALEVHLQTGFDGGLWSFEAGVVTLGCNDIDCTVVVRGAGGGEIVLPFQIYPVSVSAVRVEAFELSGGIHARLLRSGTVEQTGTVDAEILAPATTPRWTNPGLAVVNVDRLRLWNIVGIDDAAAEWFHQRYLFRPLINVATVPVQGLVGLWRSVAGGVFVDELAGNNGVLTAPAEHMRSLPWTPPRAVISRESFESGAVGSGFVAVTGP